MAIIIEIVAQKQVSLLNKYRQLMRSSGLKNYEFVITMELYLLSTGQRQRLTTVQQRGHVVDPVGVKVAIQDKPFADDGWGFDGLAWPCLGACLLDDPCHRTHHVMGLTEDLAEDALLPDASLEVAKQLGETRWVYLLGLSGNLWWITWQSALFWRKVAVIYHRVRSRNIFFGLKLIKVATLWIYIVVVMNGMNCYFWVYQYNCVVCIGRIYETTLRNWWQTIWCKYSLRAI